MLQGSNPLNNPQFLKRVSNRISPQSINDFFDASRLSIESIDVPERLLISSNGGFSYDWEQGILYDSSLGNTSIETQQRIMFDSSQFESVDWDSRVLYDTSTNESFNWDSLRCINNGQDTADLKNGLLLDYTTVSGSLNWINRVLQIGNGSDRFDWGNGNLNDFNGHNIIQLDSYSILNSSGTSIMNWSSGLLNIGVDVAITTAGKGLKIKEGTNAKMGVATLVAGTVTVNNTSVTSTSRIFLTAESPGGTLGSVYINARIAGTSFTIKSTSAIDTSTVAWMIVEPS